MEDNNQNFGMTEEETKSYQRNAIFARIKYYFSAIEPTIIKIFQAFFYYLIRFIKAFISAMVRMVLGKEV